MRLIALAACLIASLANAQSPLTNNDVIHMFAFGISPAVIKAMIGKSKAGFDLSPEGLIQLKKSGLSDDIVMTMISKSNVAVGALTRDSLYALSSGIYYESESKYAPFEPGYLTSKYSKGLGGSLKKSFSGFIPFNTKASIVGAHANMRIPNIKPVFLFVSDGPDEFFLVRLHNTDSSRQMNFEKPTNGAGPIVINDSLKMDFNIKKIENGFYEVSPTHSLPPGEYGFIYSSSARYTATRYKIYDFSIVEK
jgi:hypothetical protein